MIDHLRHLVASKETREQQGKRAAPPRAVESDRSTLHSDLKRLTLNSILSRIHYYRVHSYSEQLAVLRSLPRFLGEHNDQVSSPTRLFHGFGKSRLTTVLSSLHSATMVQALAPDQCESLSASSSSEVRLGVTSAQPVRLVVVDSIAFHFRHDMDNAALRTRRLLSFAQMLNRAATRHNFAAVVVNQVSNDAARFVFKCAPL